MFGIYRFVFIVIIRDVFGYGCEWVLMVISFFGVDFWVGVGWGRGVKVELIVYIIWGSW